LSDWTEVPRRDIGSRSEKGVAVGRHTANPVFRPHPVVWHPTVVSSDFPKLHQQMEDVLSRLKATGDPVLRRHLLADIRLLLKEAENPVSPLFPIKANEESPV